MDPRIIPLSFDGLQLLGLDSDLALYFLAFIAVASLWSSRSTPFLWSWHLILKVLLMLTAVILALTIGPRTLFTGMSWCFFIVFYLLPIVLQKVYYKQAMQLNFAQALKAAAWMKAFYWGKLGQFLYDSALAGKLALEGNKTAAEAIVSKWNKEKIPEELKEQLLGLQLQIYVLLYEWKRIVQEYEICKESGRTPSLLLYFFACRAFIELHRLNEASDCLIQIKPPKSNVDSYYLSIALFYFYCAAGLGDKVDQILSIVSEQKPGLPVFVREYWLGRLALVRKDYDQAISRLDIAYSAASVSWKPRIEIFQKLAHERANEPVEEQKDVSIILDSKQLTRVNQALQQLKKYTYAYQLFYPIQKFKTILFLIFSILIVFFIADSYFFLPNHTTDLIGEFCYKNGMLIPSAVFAGQYWRLFTSLFLHVNLVHALVNVLALFIFGRMTLRVYGVTSFVLIYFIAGILSGLSQAFFYSSEPCIGASGAIMGVFGAAVVGLFRLKQFLPLSIRQKELRSLGIILLIQLISDQLIPHIGVYAHLGGLLSGAVLGLLLPLSKTVRNELIKT